MLALNIFDGDVQILGGDQKLWQDCATFHHASEKLVQSAMALQWTAAILSTVRACVPGGREVEHPARRGGSVRARRPEVRPPLHRVQRHRRRARAQLPDARGLPRRAPVLPEIRRRTQVRPVE